MQLAVGPADPTRRPDLYAGRTAPPGRTTACGKSSYCAGPGRSRHPQTAFLPQVSGGGWHDVSMRILWCVSTAAPLQLIIKKAVVRRTPHGVARWLQAAAINESAIHGATRLVRGTHRPMVVAAGSSCATSGKDAVRQKPPACYHNNGTHLPYRHLKPHCTSNILPAPSTVTCQA